MDDVQNKLKWNERRLIPPEEFKKIWPDSSGSDVCCYYCNKIINNHGETAAYEIKHGRIVGNICIDCWGDKDEPVG